MSTIADMNHWMHVRTSKDIGALIRDRRKRLGLDQKSLAERVGVSRQWIIEVEHGKSRAAIGLVLRTLGALGVALAVAPPKSSRDKSVALPDIDAIVQRARARSP
jgi:HTH-type transcriptional regulator/antitoxin HipB